MKSLSIVLLAVVFLGVFGVVKALIGVDTSPLITFQSTFDCLKTNGYAFANVRAFTLEGIDLDLSVKDTLIYAKRAGIRTDLYIRPCRGKSPDIQVTAVMLVIAEQYYDRVWLYVDENPNVGCKWGPDIAANCNFLKEMVKQIKYFQKPVGFYSTQKFWDTIISGTSVCSELA
ncbi:unnamed protein product [Sphagnum balticum]